MLIKSYQSARGADWVVYNSFSNLEPESIQAMNPETPILTVGSLLPSGYLDIQNPKDVTVGTSFLTEYQPSEWLDTKPLHSVIYVSFGSFSSCVHISDRGNSNGTEGKWAALFVGASSRYNIFWDLWLLTRWLYGGDLQKPRIGCSMVASATGTITSSDPSIGGFFTHCGWNSVIESIVLGVPMLGFPLWSDQYTNCKFMVDEWKIGLRYFYTFIFK